MKNYRHHKLAITMLVMTILQGCLTGLFVPSKLYALTAAPELLITEIVAASGGSNQAYEYVEIYNHTSQEINLNNYKLRYYSASPYTTFANEWTFVNKTIAPRSAMVLWLQKFDNLNNPSGPNSLADFNSNYGAALSQDQLYPVKLTTSGQGLHDTAKRRITLANVSGTIVVSAYINDGAADGIKDKGIVYSYPGSGIEMTKVANSQTATPGSLINGQIPGPNPPAGVTAQPSDQSVTLSWTANEEANIASYKVYQQGAAQPATVTDTIYRVTGLINETEYKFRVTAVDTNGNESAGSSIAAAIPQLIVDTTPPEQPTGLTASTGLGTVGLSWSPNHENDIAGYRVFMDGALLTTVSAATYRTQLASLTPGRAYPFQLTALDKAGNESVKSAAVRAVPDTAPVPALLITELVPDTDNHYTGYDAFEYVELYNNSLEAIDLKGYTLKLESSDPAKSWQQSIEQTAVLRPKQTVVLWTRKAELAHLDKEAFNRNFYASYMAKYAAEDSIIFVDGVSGLINSGKQTVVLQDAEGKETVRASYNDSATDVKTNTSIVFSYPVDGTNRMRKTEAKAVPTPGQLISGQLAAIPGSDVQPPAVPSGVEAAAGNGQVTLSWSPNTELDLAAYRIYRNGKPELEVPLGQRQAIVSMLTGNVDYSFTLSAVDIYGNESPQSIAVHAVPGHQSITQQDRSEAVDTALFPDFWNMSQPGLVVPGLVEDVVPQGMAYDKEKDWLLISNYREDGRPSTLSVIDAKTNRMIKSLNLYQENNTPYTGHAGGVAISRSNVWIASGSYLYRIPLETIVQAENQDQVSFADKILTPTRASLAAYHNGVLWVGEYYEEPGYPTDSSHKLMNRDQEMYGAWLAGYKLDDVSDRPAPDHPSVNDALVPDYILSIPGNIQGVDVLDDQIILTQSFTRAKGSSLVRYKQPLGQVPDTTVSLGQYPVPVWFLDSQSRIESNGELAAPPMAEGVVDREGKLYVLFESGANAYRTTALQPLDRVQVLDLSVWKGYGNISIQGAPNVLVQGTEAQLHALQNKGNAPAVDVTSDTVFTSSNPSAALVSAQGWLTAAAPGSTVITATYGGRSSEARVSVHAKHRSNNPSSGTTGVMIPEPASAGEAPNVGNQTMLQPEDGVVDQDRATVMLTGNQRAVVLPGTLLENKQLQLANDKVSLMFSKETLQSIRTQLGTAGGTVQDTKLFFQLKWLDADSRMESFMLASQINHAQISAASEIMDVSLSLQAKNGQIPVSVSDQPIAAIFQVSGKANPALLGVYRILDDGKLQYVGGRMKDGSMEVSIDAFGSYAVLEYNKAYNDLPADHWASAAIKELTARHIVQGTSDGQFSPDGYITRAEFTALLARGLGLRAQGGKAFFTDVPSDAWYADPVAASVEAGIIRGEGEGTFEPEGKVTREQMAAMLVRACEVRTGQKEGGSREGASFADESQISTWARPYARSAVQWGLMNGKEADRLDPRSFATRAESAQVIWNLLHK
ncbi:lamin tail domain-containing protein [Paenibacillus rigui]|uniref:Uncharacterized protein n=1 Tax=Paenibacillus rigui TaxID=554312 RepID=A0A229UV85_9BACL|nr:lamin tail domain-containing protein [Paenibacillus rigui]OXM87280.1 hypothetical protein CF651_06485 [Paenibacillus rigui]